ncbi:BglG family transcription antiterminator [Streptococcus macacae]|uniref:Phosphoenolpyruvate-dependent sugar PTS family porter, EIIA 2 n=1 Tax=Streptococcus macacae NCTC 11558 TaxID=764298 RepID=G5JV36_9STRE|nr:PRD domain-containing protein [Streptococcus macacae]EHJ52233.1 phosphoenolpyruvate-dependent sugar PTS family porter, EIIA 2 [Streptococcus macacae NCTC 11558]SUN79341.1 sorbitol operon regulator [Streptococcus macacae NCTC 11558]
MALVNRWYRILEILVAQPNTSLEAMRKELGISMKTLLTSIEQLNDVLDEAVQIRQKTNRLYLEVYDYARLETILAGSLRKESDFNSSNKRASYLIKRLIQAVSPLLIDDLAEEIGVSRTTINKDLKHIKSLAKDYQIRLSGRPNRGLEMIGTELQLRLFYLHHVYSYFETDILTKEMYRFLKDLCRDYKIPRKTQELLIKVIAITVDRVQQKKLLTAPISYYVNELAESEMIEQLIYHVELTYQISLSQYEQDFLSFPFNIQYLDKLAYRPIERQEVENLYGKMIKQVKDTLLVDFDEKQLFFEMQTHFKFLLNRLIFHVQANDIFHGEIQNKYPLAFEMARVSSEELAAHFGYSLGLSEISYLALYFELVLHGNEGASYRQKHQIAVVCTTGRGTANMIKRQLRRVLGNEIEITQYSEEDFNPKLNDHYFAIFTTIPLKLEHLNSPVIQITHLFDDQWLREEWQRVSHYHRKNLKTITLKFSRLAKADSYKEYLMAMISELEQSALVDADFRRRILERERQQSTIFGNDVAFPHTINQLSTKTVLMLGILEEAYQTDKESLEFIFLLAIPSEIESQTEAELLDLYDDIFQIAGDKELKTALRQVKNQAEFVIFTKEKGVL